MIPPLFASVTQMIHNNLLCFLLKLQLALVLPGLTLQFTNQRKAHMIGVWYILLIATLDITVSHFHC